MNERLERELLIVGGGPAGLAAAVEARRAGVQTLLVDERASLGGQIFKQLPKAFTVRRPDQLDRDQRIGRKLIDMAMASGAELRTATVAWGIWGKRVALYSDSNSEGGQGSIVDPRLLILATGAYDRPVAFPGWTLPGVMSAGGAQSLVKIQRVLPGEHILMVGSGPLVLAFSAQLHRYGANVVAVAEAAPFPGPAGLLRLMRAAPGNVKLLLEGLGYMAYLRRAGVPFLYSHAIARAEGRTEVERAVVTRVDRDWRPIAGTERGFDVDTICVGYGFFPSTELSQLAGCAHDYDEDLGGYVPRRHNVVWSSVPEILVAGDDCGVAGAAIAVQEGRLAGITAALDLGRISASEAERRAAPLRARLATLERFRGALAANYAVGPGIYELCTRETTVCRCEEVTAGEILDNILVGSADPNSVRNLTRAGMGQCQGRNCARQVASIVARQADKRIADLPTYTPRPPAKPVPIRLIAEERPEEEPVAEVG